MESIKRNAKKSFETNDLCVTSLSLTFFSLRWKYWPQLVRKYATFLNVGSV